MDSSGLAAEATVEVRVTPPQVAIEVLTGPFLLTGGAPTGPQLAYLDWGGNRNGIYDLGDLRAFVLANPGLPMSAGDRGLLQAVAPAGRSGGGER